jgi:hypothetical protein
MDDESYRHGFETALELCIAQINETETKEKALVKIMEYLGLVKADKLGRVEEDLLKVKR